MGEVSSAEDAIALLGDLGPKIGLIVLDHKLAGEITGIQAAPRLKALAPAAKIIMFCASELFRAEAAAEPAIDGFLLKTEPTKLIPLARRLSRLSATA